MGIEPTRASLLQLENKQFGAIPNAKCDWRVNFGALIAVAAHALAGDEIRAASWAANVRSRNPALTRPTSSVRFP
jgi:hypothetical protein